MSLRAGKLFNYLDNGTLAGWRFYRMRVKLQMCVAQSAGSSVIK